MDSFEQELKAGFLEEATQLLTEAEQCFLLLESNPGDITTLEKIFRIAHNIKGSSKAVGFDALGAFTHEFESFMLKCKSGIIPILPSTITLLLKCNDHIKQFIDLLRDNHSAGLDCDSLVAEIHDFKAEEPAPQEMNEATPEAAPQTEEIPVATSQAASEPVLEAADEISILPEIPSPEVVSKETISPAEVNPPEEEMISLNEIKILTKITQEEPPVPSQKVVSPPEVTPEFAPAMKPQVPAQPAKPVGTPSPQPAKKSNAANAANPAAPSTATPAEESIRVSLSRLEKLLNFVGELVILQTVLKEQVYSPNPQILRKTIHQMGKVTKEVQELSMSLRMIPLKQTFQKMQRIVRDTCSVLGKKVQFTLQGEDTEVDKTVLEALSDPLVHLIRNAVDHGIESPEDRIAKGKPETGKVTLRAFHESGKLVIEIKDNGGGIPAEKLRQKAIEKGILNAGQTLTDKEAIHLIFHPGFSTKTEVTEVSGRGVGMDVVKTNIEHMQGEVLVETVLNEGSTFRIILPLTLAIIDGMVVKCGDDRFVIPLSHVHETVKPETKDLKFATGVGEILLLRGENLPVVRLSQALGKKKTAKSTLEQIAIIIRTQGNPFAALVDDVIGQHQVVIKKLGSEIQHLRGYSGSAILGDGKPALILELGDLMKNPSNPIKKQVAA